MKNSDNNEIEELDESDLWEAVNDVVGQWPDESKDAVTHLFVYLVEASLSGEAHKLNAYTIGTEALGRSKEFDPSSNSAVRTTMFKLRARLNEHYSVSTSHEIEFTIPKGTYELTYLKVEKVSASNSSHSTVETSVGKKSALPSALMLSLLGLIAVILATLVFFYLDSETNQPEPVSNLTACRDDLPTVRFLISDQEAQANELFVKYIVSGFEQADRSYPFLQFTDGLDCTNNQIEFELQVKKFSEKGNSLVDVELRQTQNSVKSPIIWSNKIALPDEITTQDMDDLISSVSYAIGDFAGIVPVLANSENYSWANKEYRKKYNCIVGSLQQIHSEDLLTYTKYTECISGYYDSNKKDSTVYSIYAMFLQYEKMAIFPTILSKRAETLVNAIAKAEATDKTNKWLARVEMREFREQNIANFNQRNRLYDLIRFVEFNHKYDPKTLSIAARMRGQYLGQWDDASNTIERSRKNIGQDDVLQYYELSKNIAVENDAMAHKLATTMHPQKRAIYQIQIAVAAYYYGDKILLDAALVELESKGITSQKEAKELIQKAHYHRTLERRLLDAVSEFI